MFSHQKERFTPVYLDSENYYKQNTNAKEQQLVNKFTPTESPYNSQFQTGYNNPYTTQWNQNETYYPLQPVTQVNQQDYELWLSTEVRTRNFNKTPNKLFRFNII